MGKSRIGNALILAGICGVCVSPLGSGPTYFVVMAVGAVVGFLCPIF